LFDKNSQALINIIDENINAAIDKITSFYHEAGEVMSQSPRKKDEQPKWWDENCNFLKMQKYKYLRKFRLSNSLIDLREYKNRRNTFKNYCNNKMREFQTENRRELINNRNNPNYLWTKIKQAKQKICTDISISPNDWRNYFSDLLYDNNAPPILLDDIAVDPAPNTISLNSPIILSEVKDAIRKLKNGKSCGIDGIPSEYYKYTFDILAPYLVKIFNNIFETKEFPNSWGKSIICPIHKSGPTHMPENYRGISLTNTMYKIFTGVINKRLYEWAETNNKIDESQSGFRTGYSAIDNIFCLQAIAQKYLSKKEVDFIVYTLTSAKPSIKSITMYSSSPYKEKAHKEFFLCFT